MNLHSQDELMLNHAELRTDGDVIRAYLHHLDLVGHPATTIATYRTALTRAARELADGMATDTDELQEWLGTLRSSSARNVYRAALRGFFAWARRRGLVNTNPAADVDQVKVEQGLPRPCTDDELATILAGAREPVRLWSLIAAYAGARCCEIARLDRGDISQREVYLFGKGGRERLVPAHPELWAAVHDLPPGLLAGGRSGSNVSQRCAREYDRLGLGDVTAHRLRHWAGTRWQEATGDVRVTQQLMGHASVATTQVYTAVSDARMRQAVMALPPITPAGAGESIGRDVDQG